MQKDCNAGKLCNRRKVLAKLARRSTGVEVTSCLLPHDIFIITSLGIIKIYMTLKECTVVQLFSLTANAASLPEITELANQLFWSTIPRKYLDHSPKN